jgi:type I restriction enzyme S subunit
VIPQADFERAVGRKVTRILQHLEKRRHVEVDDFVISMRSFQGGLERAWASGCIRSSYVVLRPTAPLVVGYYAYLFKSNGYIRALQSTASFIRDGQDLNFSNFCEVDLPCPPRSEQSAIARVLDHADRRIGRYIRTKQKLVKLVEEQKQALIHRAVTRGLDPKVRLRSSGVEWLGEVPQHWDVAALRHRYSQALGKMLDAKRIAGTHLLPYLRNTDVQWDRINVAHLPTMDIAPAEYDRYTVKMSDLLVCEGGDVGRCAIWNNQLDVCGFQKALHRLRPVRTDRDLPRFMYYALRAAAKGNAFSDGHVSTIAHLTGDKLRAHPFPFPPLAEQETIVSALDRQLSRLESAVTITKREIELLREYRTCLIADVVTGKVDVRDVAVRLSENLEEREVFNETESERASEDGAGDAVAEEAEA